MLVHLRLTTPADLTDPVLEILLDRDWITNVTVDRGSSLKPPGDLVECDAAREKTASLLWKLRHLGLDEVGGIVLTDPVGTPFRAAAELEAAAPGHPDDAVIWEAVEAQAEAGAVPTLSYHLFMVLAVALAAVAVITDSSVLVVGAMVVGPEFSAVAAGCAGIALRRWGLLGRGLRLLVVGFVFAILVVTAAAVLGRALGLVTLDEVTGPRPNTGFIWHPDTWSLVVALLAGAAGALALALSKASTMVGVFISVTTVPAAGNLALGLAFLDRKEIVGSSAQLVINIAGMLVSGALVLLLMRWRWRWMAVVAERAFGIQSVDRTGLARYR